MQIPNSALFDFPKLGKQGSRFSERRKTQKPEKRNETLFGLHFSKALAR